MRDPEKLSSSETANGARLSLFLEVAGAKTHIYLASALHVPPLKGHFFAALLAQLIVAGAGGFLMTLHFGSAGVTRNGS